MSGNNKHEVLALADLIAAAPDASAAALELMEQGAWATRPMEAALQHELAKHHIDGSTARLFGDLLEHAFGSGKKLLVIHQDMLAAMLRDMTTWPYSYSSGDERDPSEGPVE